VWARRARNGHFRVFRPGQAGSGKTTLMQRLNAHMYEQGTPAYVMNLDPAVRPALSCPPPACPRITNTAK
jgi:adenylylsulfate kinase-like enzyme